LLYVDNFLLFSKSTLVFESILTQLGKQFKVKPEDDVHAYLGLEVIKHPDGHITLRQPGLIDKVMSICGLEAESNTHSIPADSILQPLSSSDGP
jgi:hypothetical protein